MAQSSSLTPEKNLLLTKAHWQEMLAHILRHLPEEACGLVGGQGGKSEVVIPVTNQLHSAVRFRMDAQEQFSAFMRLEEQNLDLLAIFHSHPQGPQVPSQTDRSEFAYPGVITIIWSPVEGVWQARAFLLSVEPDLPAEEIRITIV